MYYPHDIGRVSQVAGTIASLSMGQFWVCTTCRRTVERQLLHAFHRVEDQILALIYQIWGFRTE